jgi:hypothetical protein
MAFFSSGFRWSAALFFSGFLPGVFSAIFSAAFMPVISQSGPRLFFPNIARAFSLCFALIGASVALSALF